MAFGGRNPPANAGDVSDGVQSLGWEDPLEEGMLSCCYWIFFMVQSTVNVSGALEMGVYSIVVGKHVL